MIATQPFLVYALADASDAGKLESICREHVTRQLEVSVFTRFACLLGANPPTLATNQDFLSYGQIVARLHQCVDILPFRYGTVSTLAALDEQLGRNEVALDAMLNRVRDCSEINVRWVLTVDNPEFADKHVPAQTLTSSGAKYLRDKRRASSVDQAIQKKLYTLSDQLRGQFTTSISDANISLRALDTERAQTNAKTKAWIAGIELLVRRCWIEEVQDHLRQIRFETVRPSIVSGPWPPYSFVR